MKNVEISKSRIKAASFLLSGDNIEHQLNLIDNAPNGSIDIPEGVILWDLISHINLENLIDTLNDLQTIIENANDDFINYKNNIVVECIDKQSYLLCKYIAKDGSIITKKYCYVSKSKAINKFKYYLITNKLI